MADDKKPTPSPEILVKQLNCHLGVYITRGRVVTGVNMDTDKLFVKRMFVKPGISCVFIVNVDNEIICVPMANITFFKLA